MLYQFHIYIYPTNAHNPFSSLNIITTVVYYTVNYQVYINTNFCCHFNNNYSTHPDMLCSTVKFEIQATFSNFRCPGHTALPHLSLSTLASLPHELPQSDLNCSHLSLSQNTFPHLFFPCPHTQCNHILLHMSIYYLVILNCLLGYKKILLEHL